MRVCQKCAHPLKEGASFCSHCGSEYQPPQDMFAPIEKPTNEICTRCGAKRRDGAKFCPKCGLDYHNTNHQPTLFVQKSPKTVKKRFVYAAIAAVLALSVTVYFMNAELFVPRGSLGAFSQSKSGSKAFKITPAKGLTISAPANALDKDRKFTAQRLTKEEIMRAENHIRKLPGIIPLDGYEVDAGLDPKKMFPGQINLSVDLKEMGISPNLYRYLTAVRIGSDGYTEILENKVSENQLEIKSRKNSVTLICLLVVLGGVSGVGANHLNNEVSEEFLTGFPQYKNRNIAFSFNLNGYTFFWPDDLPPSDPDAVNELKASLNNVIKKHGFTSMEDFQKELYDFRTSVDMNEKVMAVLTDSDYVAIDEKLKDRDFVFNKVYPVKVRKAVYTVYLADSYLFDNENRGFRKQPSTYIGLLDDWPYQKDWAGISFNPKIGSPYVHVNLNSLPDSQGEIKSLTGDERSRFEDALLTITHEIFHVSQAQYVTYDAHSYLWLWEASADLLQYEAAKYFETQGQIAKAEIPLEALKNIFLLKYTMSKADDSLIQNQGYGSALFLKQLRDKYYAGKENDFIKTVLENFSSITSSTDGLTLMKNLTCGNDKTFGEEFEAFVTQNVNELIDSSKPNIILNRAKPIVSLDMPSGYFSSYLTSFVFEDPDNNRLFLRFDKDAVTRANKRYSRFVIPKTATSFDGGEIMLSSLELKEGFYDYMVSAHNIGRSPSGKNATFLLQTINGFLSEESNKVPMDIQAFLLTKPEKPSAEVGEDKITLKLPTQTALEQPGQNGKRIVDSYIAHLVDAEGASVVFEIPVDYNSFEIPLKDGGKKVDTAMLNNTNTKTVNAFKSANIQIASSPIKDSFEIHLFKATNANSPVFSSASEKLIVGSSALTLIELAGTWAKGGLTIRQNQSSEKEVDDLVGSTAGIKVTITAGGSSSGELTMESLDGSTVSCPINVKLVGTTLKGEGSDSYADYTFEAEVKKADKKYQIIGIFTAHNKSANESVIMKFTAEK